VLPADELAVDEQFGVELKNPATDAYILTNSKSPWANRTVRTTSHSLRSP
jgi:hypothetical protein